MGQFITLQDPMASTMEKHLTNLSGISYYEIQVSSRFATNTDQLSDE